MKSVEQQYKNVHIRNAKPGEVDPSQAIKVNSVEEYQNVLKNLSSLQKYTVSTMPVAISKSNTNSVKLDEVSDIAEWPISGILLIPPVNICCQFDYVAYNGTHGWYFASISNVHSWLSGLQVPVGYSWTQESSSVDYYNYRTHAKTTITGQLETYLLVNGAIKIADQNESYTWDWTVKG